MNRARVHTFAIMGTTVTFRAPGAAVASVGADGVEDAFTGAAAWFQAVEEACNRFDPASELSRLSSGTGVPIPVSPLLYGAVEFAVALAGKTSGAFDPTMGKRMEGLGFDTSYRTGERISTPIPAGEAATYRDVRLDPIGRTICLTRPLLLDLGAVAKGLAIDLAARELAPLGSFVIDAGGDLWLEGSNDEGAPWTVGIRDPRGGEEPLELLEVTGSAVCTSGDYERRGREGATHIVDPRSGLPVVGISSVTVIGPSAMVADGLSTAATVLGPVAGLDLLESEDAIGIMYDARGQRFATTGAHRSTGAPEGLGVAAPATN